MFKIIEKLANDLSETHKERWSYLVHAVVDVYKQKKKDEEAGSEDAEDEDQWFPRCSFYILYRFSE